MDKDLILKLLRHSKLLNGGNADVTVDDIDIRIGNPNDGFCSTIMFVKCNNNDKFPPVVVKSIADTTTSVDPVMAEDIISREVQFYKSVQLLYKDDAVLLNVVPLVYFAGEMHGKLCIVMEDLNTNYKFLSWQEGLSLEYLMVAVRMLATVNARLKVAQCNGWNEQFSPLNLEPLLTDFAEKIQSWRDCFQRCAGSEPPIDMESACQSARKEFGHEACTPFLGPCHGDVWMKQYAFGRVASEDCLGKLFDWQFFSSNSCMLNDLACLLTSSAGWHVLKSKRSWLELIDLFCITYNENIGDCSCAGLNYEACAIHFSRSVKYAHYWTMTSLEIFIDDDVVAKRMLQNLITANDFFCS